MNNPVSIIGEHPEFLNLLDATSNLAKLTRPILIQGERGVGKELIAARLHYLSSRWQGTYVTLNCAAISESLLEAELFGAEVGAYTGAIKKRAGRLERADGGTLFLDEIASMSLMMQEKLLRFIEYGEVERLGGHKTQILDVRVVAASNIDLPSLAARGEFRADLLDRLAFDVLTIPPLRARGDDILLLATHFARRLCLDIDREVFLGFTDQAKQQLCDYPWPGNVRELKNVVERSLFHHPDPLTAVADLIFDPFASPYRPSSVLQPDVNLKDQANIEQSPVVAEEEITDLRLAVAAFESEKIQSALVRSQYRVAVAAKELGLNYHQLRHLMKKHSIDLH